MQALLQAFAAAAKPEGPERIGMEYERFVLRADGAPVPYSGPDGVEELLRDLQRRLGWDALEEQGRLLGLQAADGAGFSLEPGAQLEYASRPHASLRPLAQELAGIDALVAARAAQRSQRLHAAGVHPSATPQDLELIPKARYAVLEPYLRRAGELGLWMMKCTCGVQFSLDYRAPEDAARKLRVALRLAPVFLALSANSPRAGYRSFRGHIWSRTDPARCGIPQALTRADSTLADYLLWAQSVPRIFAEPLRHLSTLFPESRLRPGRLELRCFDSVPAPLALGFAALVKGVFYDPAALSAAEALSAAWSYDQLLAAWHGAQRFGLDAPGLREQARALLDSARLPPEERGFLAPVAERLAGA
ncbi:MAG: hypothetical protein EYC70_14865 [Planctomycetota bacterium]|nr:MAG: hypothetical protein EYC70_14865 [Planctomycetota bacterium]